MREVVVGCRVRLYRKGGEAVVMVYDIVEGNKDLEAMPVRLAANCQIVQAILGREVGDIVPITVPNRRPFEVIVLEIEPLPEHALA